MVSEGKSRGLVQIPSDDLAVGSRLGDYEVHGLLGKGGMGVVYLAFDPKLKRKVALKLFRGARESHDVIDISRSFHGGLNLSNEGTGVTSDVVPDRSANRRLLQEAQAMAKLAHPNVVSVYQVGEFDNRVFIAMEHIEGLTLHDWVAKNKPSTHELLQVMIQAGRGLQAAHSAGIVHRDFKGENVLIGKDGRVCVTDFGLAGTDVTGTGMTADSDVVRHELRGGTPRYMSPEQHRGIRTDARTDQFSFCVTLFRALFGVWPFPGESQRDYADAVIQGRVQWPRMSSKERWLRPIFERGFSVEPSKRFPSMEVLLAKLDRKSTTGRNLAIGAAVLVLAAGGGAFAYMSQKKDALTCTGSESHLASVWNPAVTERVKAAMLATGVPYAASTANNVTAGLTDYATQWTTMHHATCEATRRGEQSEKLLDLRMACLDRLKGEFGIVIDLAAKVDAESIQNSMKSVHGLSPINDCARSESLSNVVPEPTDPEAAKTLRRLQIELDTAKAELNIGQYKKSLERVAALSKDIETLGYAPVEAEALLLRGRLEWRLGQLEASETSLVSALAAAERGRDDDKRLLALIELTYVVGYEGGRVTEGLAWAKIAEGMLGHMSHERFKAQFIQNRATVYFRAGNYEKALEGGIESCDAFRRVLGEQHRTAAECLSRNGVVLLRMGRNEESLKLQEQALPIAEAALGKDHPALGDFLTSAGNSYAAVGNVEKASAMYTRALDLSRRAFGPQHPTVAVALTNLGSLQFAQGDYKGALERYLSAVEIEEKALGSKHRSLAETLGHVGDTYLALEQPADAVAPLERAWAIYAEAKDKPPEVGALAFSLARALWDSGTRDRGMELAQQAKQIASAGDSEDDKALVTQVDEWVAQHANAPPPPKGGSKKKKR